MQKKALVGLIALCFAVTAFAGTVPAAGTKHAEGHRTNMSVVGHKVYNNVVQLTADGARTALCLCGKEFTVTDASPTVDLEGTTYYLCSDHCKEMAGSATKEATSAMAKEWWTKFHARKLASNAFTKDGKEMATCFCGKTFEVVKGNPMIIENGVKAYLCSNACKTAVHGMSAADRLQKELGVVKGAQAPPEK